MTFTFTYKCDSTAQLFENILVNWIGFKDQWFIYYYRTFRDLDCSETWLSRVSWTKLILKAKIPFVL